MNSAIPGAKLMLADAQRNYDAILAATKAVFAQTVPCFPPGE